MSAADRCQLAAIVTGGLSLATESAWLGYLTIALLWFAVINLSAEIRAARRRERP